MHELLPLYYNVQVHFLWHITHSTPAFVRSVTWSQGGKEFPTYNIKKANFIGHILSRNFILKHLIERKIEERIGMTGRQSRRRRQLLDDFKEKKVIPLQVRCGPECG